jgi:Tfp pilus assembly protein PilV
MKNRRRKFRKGFSFVEVVVSSAVLVVALVPILKCLTGAHMGSVFIERRSRSLVYAQKKLDELRPEIMYNYSDDFDQNGSFGSSYDYKVTDTSENSNLRNLTVSTGYDLNSNDLLDNGEELVTLHTQLAKRF